MHSHLNNIKTITFQIYSSYQKLKQQHEPPILLFLFSHIMSYFSTSLMTSSYVSFPSKTLSSMNRTEKTVSSYFPSSSSSFSWLFFNSLLELSYLHSKSNPNNNTSAKVDTSRKLFFWFCFVSVSFSSSSSIAFRSAS